MAPQSSYRGMTLEQIAKDRWLWRDESCGYCGCTYSTPDACKRVIDGLLKLAPESWHVEHSVARP